MSGGKASGAISESTYEKDINLGIAKRLNHKLLENGYKTALTRDMDYYVGINERCRIANREHTDIFVSIHCNASFNPNAQGTEVLYYPTSTEGKKLSKLVYDEFIKELKLAKRGIKPRDDLGVLKYTNMPAILVEVAFISNPVEKELLEDTKFQDKTVEAIFRGIEKYFKGSD